MEEIDVEIKGENKEKIDVEIKGDRKSQQQIVGAIILAGVLIAGAILLKDNSPRQQVANIPTNQQQAGNAPAAVDLANIQLDPVGPQDRVLGNTNAKVTVIEYADFQCPFCGRFFQDAGQVIINNYVKNGKVEFVYRDYAFLGQESISAAEAARCAGDQNKFWEYHDYLFTHQKGENQGAFSNPNLKSFAKTLGLNTTSFNQCLDANKYAQAVTDSNQSASKAGVNSTPKGFILKNGKIVDTIEGAEPSATVTAKIDAALK